MLVEVIDEKPAAERSDGLAMTGNHEDDVLGQLVTHYAQAIHIPAAPQSPRPYFSDSTTNTSPKAPLPAVLKFCFEQFIQLEENGEGDDDANTHKRNCTRRNLLVGYPTRIHTTLFDNHQQITLKSTGIAVLYHYEWLLSLLLETVSHSPDETTSSRIDDTLHFGEERHFRETLMETVQCLLQDLTVMIPQVVGGNVDDTTTETKHRLYLYKTYVIPSLLRLLQKSFRLYFSTPTGSVGTTTSSSLPPQHADLIRQVVVRLFSWTTPYVGPSTVASGLRDAFSYPSLSTTPDTYAMATTTTPSAWNGLDWDPVMQLTNHEWCTKVSAEAAVQCLLLICGRSKDDSGVAGDDIRQEVCQKLGWLDMAQSIRAHFFGKNDFSEPEGIIVPQRTRLHLGRTVTEEPVEYDKPYVTVPTRLYSFYVFTSLLPQISSDIITSLVPILYELLAAPRDSIQGMAAVCLYHLLHISQESKFVWSPAILSNLQTALDLAIQTCRKGAVLSVLGVTQAALLRRLPSPEDAQQRRRKASQQWLMILSKNIQNTELVWGVLAGALVHLGRDHVLTEANDALELGRLVLSCHLPLIGQEEGTATMSMNGLGSEIQLLALISLSHWLVAAHAVMLHHEGKILGSLLMCQCRNPKTSARYVWSRHLSAMLVIMSDWSGTLGEKVSDKLTAIIESGDYQETLVNAAKEVLEEAERLKEKLVSASY